MSNPLIERYGDENAPQQFALTLRDRVRKAAASTAAEAVIVFEHVSKSHSPKEA